MPIAATIYITRNVQTFLDARLRGGGGVLRGTIIVDGLCPPGMVQCISNHNLMEQFVVKQDEKKMSHLARTPDDVIFGEDADTCPCCLGSSRYFDKIWVRKRLHTSNKSK